MPISSSTMEMLAYFILQQNKQLLSTIAIDYDIDLKELLELIPKRCDIIECIQSKPQSKPQPKQDNNPKKVVKHKT